MQLRSLAVYDHVDADAAVADDNMLVVAYGCVVQVGLVLVDRNTVAVGPVDVVLSFGAHPAEIPGQVR